MFVIVAVANPSTAFDKAAQVVRAAGMSIGVFRNPADHAKNEHATAQVDHDRKSEQLLKHRTASEYPAILRPRQIPRKTVTRRIHPRRVSSRQHLRYFLLFLHKVSTARKGVSMGFKNRRIKPLDWSQLHEDGHTFQAMSLALFGDKHENGFAPGPLHRGPDGGWDGQFDGKIELFAGTWKVACAVRSSFAALRTKVIQENKKALRDSADALLVMTSLDLKNPQIRELEALAAKGLQKGKLWSRSKLATLVNQNAWVASTYFNLQFVAGFAPPGAPDSLIAAQQDISLMGRDDELQAVSEFLNGPARVLIVSGPGGCGKSRLIREISTILERVDRGRRPSVWVRRNGAGSIDDALKTSLPKNRALVLCVDDAGQELVDVKALVQLAAQPKGNLDVKTIVVSRAADVHRVGATCRKTNVLLEQLVLERIDHRGASGVATHDGPNLDDKAIERLVQVFGGNLYLLRAATQLLNAGSSPGKLLDDDSLRALIVDRFLDESEAALANTASPIETRQQVLEMALRTPVEFSTIRNNPVLQVLEKQGLLRRVGNRVRIRTDVEGDLLLRELSNQPEGRVCVETFLDHADDALRSKAIRNLAAAGGEQSEILLRSICSQWIAEARQTSSHKRRDRLKLLPYLANYAPDLATTLCQRYMHLPAPPSSSPRAEHIPNYPLTTDNLGPALRSIGLNGDIGAAFDLLLEVITETPIGTYSNYQPAGLVSDFLSPVYSNSERILQGIAWMASSMEAGDRLPERATLIAKGLTTVLSPTVSWNTSFGMEVSFNEQSLNPTEAVIRWRDEALALLELGLVCDFVAIRQVCAKAAGSLRLAHLGRASIESMRPRIADEIRRVLPTIAKRILVEEDIPTLHELHEGLIRRWATGDAMAEEAGEILLKYEEPALLRAYDLCSGPWNWIPNLRAQMNAAPEEGRWPWWVSERSADATKEQAIDDLLVALREQHPGHEGFMHVADTLLATKNPSILFERWWAVDPTLFEELASQEAETKTHEFVRWMEERLLVRHSADEALARIRSLVAAADSDGLKRVSEYLSNSRTW